MKNQCSSTSWVRHPDLAHFVYAVCHTVPRSWSCLYLWNCFCSLNKWEKSLQPGHCHLKLTFTVCRKLLRQENLAMELGVKGASGEDGVDGPKPLLATPLGCVFTHHKKQLPWVLPCPVCSAPTSNSSNYQHFRDFWSFWRKIQTLSQHSSDQHPSQGNPSLEFPGGYE